MLQYLDEPSAYNPLCAVQPLLCVAGDAASTAASSVAGAASSNVMTGLANAVLEAVGRGVASLGTMWVNIGTPTLTGGGGSTGVSPGDHAANAEGINTVLGWATWIAFGICVLSLIAAGARMGLGQRGEGQRHVDRITVILLATITTSAAVGLVTAIAPAVGSNGSPAVAFVQNSLWWYMIAVATIGVIFGAVRMAWEQRAEPGKDLVKSLLTLAVVSGTGLTVVSLLVAAADSFSVWLLDGSLECSIQDTDGTCFGGNMAALLALTVNPATGGLGAILVIVLGLLAIFGSIVQILLMIVRAGMIVVLAGILPVAAAATNTETGRNMFRKTVGWQLAFILYKPAAAIVYATSFKLAGTSIFKDDGSGLISVIVGLTLMAVAVIALPALMSLIVPAVSSIASGAGMTTAAIAGAAMLPTGAVAAGRLLGGSGGGSSGGDSSAPPSGSTTTGGPSGGTGGSGPSPRPGGSGTGSPGGTSPAGASGEVKLTGRSDGDDEKAVLDVSGLKPNADGDFYELWLIGDNDELVSLGSFRVPPDGRSQIEVPVPVNPGKYRYFDVSIEPDDGSPDHSGRSVLRGPTKT